MIHHPDQLEKLAGLYTAERRQAADRYRLRKLCRANWMPARAVVGTALVALGWRL